MPALPCGRTLPVGAGRPTARSIPSLLPPINGINDGRNSISHAGSGSCPKPDLRPHRPSFITDAAPDKTGAALFVFSRRVPLSRSGKSPRGKRFPAPRKRESPSHANTKTAEGLPSAAAWRNISVTPFFFASSAEAFFICISCPHHATAHRFRRRAFNEECKGALSALSPDSLPLRGRTLTPPLSRRDTDRGA